MELDVKSNEELLRAQTSLWAHTFNYIDAVVLKAAVELGIADAIHSHGRPMTLSELLPAISVPESKSNHLRHLMAMLTHAGIFDRANKGEGEEEVYSLTPQSCVLVKGRPSNLSAFVIGMVHPVFINPFHSTAAWLRGEVDNPLEAQFGCRRMWDITGRDPAFSKIFNESQESDARYLMDVLPKECKHLFEGVGSLVDVGGGTGSVAKGIAKAFPDIHCSVLELPHVVEAADKDQGAEFVAGDMFKYVPPADAVLLKWILHDWNDDECVAILKNCREAITANKDLPGKVMIVEQVVGYNISYPEAATSQLYFDMLMMVVLGGFERSEHEWNKIFIEAGFKSYKITPALGIRSIIEVFP